ncbi:triose-phosphate isomerase [uncultured Boseongicola sp.]|jgi:triosephosphate isomerase|uniref:triose-phosphate isomerase n=1 Tax=uncultured Boseongicola sp. TaxID=1648499 RepID=UPI00260970D3|nr:triose-phosphate isomerase [uncultured Boseongicola sp.]
MARKLAAGNWKMNGAAASLAEIDALAKAHPDPTCDVLICPPATLLSRLSDRASGTAIQSGGQDCHAAVSGAHTGDISAQMIADAGGSHVIVGHSERRADHGETDADIVAKAQAVWGADLVAVICVGETLAEREAGQTINIVAAQLAGSIPDGATGDTTVIAYEPVWAIGTGKVPTLEEIAEVHADIRARLTARFGPAGADMLILYGGSVKPSNADEIFGVPDVDGALVGGASLKAEDFGGIIAALERA